MKNVILFFAVLSIVLPSFGQNILLVDNTPTRPGGSHVYASLQAAHDAAIAGDIIHVKPSNTSYGNLTITKDSLSFFGVGFNPDKEILLKSSVARIDIDASNIRFGGFVASQIDVGNNFANISVGNIQIENCQITNNAGIHVGEGSPETTANVIIRNCISNQIDIFGNANNTVVTNSIIYYSTSTTTGAMTASNGTLVSHCLFYGDGGTRNAFENITNSTVSNCIFFGRAPRSSGSNSNNTFNNCFSTGAYINTFSTGSGNAVNGTVVSASGTVLVDSASVGGLTWNQNWNPALDPASVELINAGDDGTDIGVTGGTSPFNYNGTSLPYIKSFVVPSVIKQGENLDVSINALGN